MSDNLLGGNKRKISHLNDLPKAKEQIEAYAKAVAKAYRSILPENWTDECKKNNKSPLAMTLELRVPPDSRVAPSEAELIFACGKTAHWFHLVIKVSASADEAELPSLPAMDMAKTILGFYQEAAAKAKSTEKKTDGSDEKQS